MRVDKPHEKLYLVKFWLDGVVACGDNASHDGPYYCHGDVDNFSATQEQGDGTPYSVADAIRLVSCWMRNRNPPRIILERCDARERDGDSAQG